MFFIYRLPGKLPDEKIIKITRRDYFILFKKFFFFGLLAVLPLTFLYIMNIAYPLLLDGGISYPLIVLGGSAYYLFLWLFFFFSFIDFYLDIWIVTNERIIDIRQSGFFSRKISELRLDKVQDVTSETRGVFPTVLKYGDVEVQTAGEESKFLFSQIPDPEEIRNMIIKLAHAKKDVIHNT